MRVGWSQMLLVGWFEAGIEIKRLVWTAIGLSSGVGRNNMREMQHSIQADT